MYTQTQLNWKRHGRFTLPLILLGLLTLLVAQHTSNGVQLIQAASEFPAPVFLADHEGVPCVLDEDNYSKSDRTAMDQWEGQGSESWTTRTGGLSPDYAGGSYANIEAVNEDGDCALKISLFDTENSGRVGRFLYMSNFRHSNPYTPLPSPGYYSVWMKVPENYNSDHSWNVFQFQNRVFEELPVPGLPGVEIDHDGPERMFGVHLLTNESTGNLEFNIVLHDYLTNFLEKSMREYKNAGYSDNAAYEAAHRFACYLENDTCQKTSYQDLKGALEWLTGSPPSNIPVPIGEWFRLTAYIEESTVNSGNIQPDGRFVMWLNDDQILYEDDIITKLHPDGKLHWEINSYNSKGRIVSPSGQPIELFIDDAQIIEMDVPDNEIPNPPPMPATSTFSAPELLAPADGSSVSGQPQLEWRDVDAATRYRIQIQRSDNSDRVLLTNRFSASGNCSGGRCSYQPDTALFDNGTEYKWQVEAVDSSNTSKWSSYYHFTLNTFSQPTNTPRPTQTPVPQPTQTPVPPLPTPTQTPSSGESAVLLTFEDGVNDWRTYAKSNSAISFSQTAGYGSNSALQVSYDVPSNGYAAAYTSNLPLRDWRDFESVQFAFYGSNSGDELKFQIFDNGREIFEATFDDNASGWRLITLPFDAFTRASWQPSGAPNDGLTLSDVQRIDFKIDKDSRSVNTTFRVDDVTLNAAAQVESDMLFDFNDSSVWDSYNKSNSAIDFSIAADQLIVVYDVPSNGYAAVFSNDLPFRDWRGYSAIQFEFYGWGSGDEITFEIYDNGNEIFQARFDDNVNGWQTITLPISDFVRGSWQPSGAPNNGLTLSDVQRITFKIGGDDTSINSTFEVDDVMLVE